MTETLETVRTGLYIGGAERHTADTIAIADPAKPGVVVGHAASASPDDVADAVASAKAAFPAWSALTAADRAPRWPKRSRYRRRSRHRRGDSVAGERQDPLRELDRRLVFEIRWNLALMIADEVDTARRFPSCRQSRSRPSCRTSRSGW
jgi:hypothetical protein